MSAVTVHLLLDAEPPSAPRTVAAGVFVGGIHLAALLALVLATPQDAPKPEPVAAVLMDLPPATETSAPQPGNVVDTPAPAPAQPQSNPPPTPPEPATPEPPPPTPQEPPPPELAPTPPQPVEPPPIEVPKVPQDVAAPVPVPVVRPPPPKPKPHHEPVPPRPKVAKHQSPPKRAAERRHEVGHQSAASAAPSGATATGASAASWKSALMGKLVRSRRYPAAARAAREQGVVVVSFTIDRGGRVLSSHIVQGSGHPLLDEEALATLQRANPLPAPPEGLGGGRISLTVPLRFNVN